MSSLIIEKIILKFNIATIVETLKWIKWEEEHFITQQKIAMKEFFQRICSGVIVNAFYSLDPARE